MCRWAASSNIAGSCATTDTLLIPPQWYIQQPVFVHKAHYHFDPTKTGRTIIHTDDAWPRGCGERAPLHLQSSEWSESTHEGLDGYDLTGRQYPAAAGRGLYAALPTAFPIA